MSVFYSLVICKGKYHVYIDESVVDWSDESDNIDKCIFDELCVKIHDRLLMTRTAGSIS